MTGIINHNGRPIRGRQRHDGWTPKRCKVFLDMLAATGSVKDSEAAAGMSQGSARNVRRRDARFGELWDEALALAYRRLEDELLAYALGRAVSPDDPGSERDEPAAEHRPPFDPRLAIQILKLRGWRSPAGRKRSPPLDPAAVDAALMKKLADLAERLEAQ